MYRLFTLSLIAIFSLGTVSFAGSGTGNTNFNQSFSFDYKAKYQSYSDEKGPGTAEIYFNSKDGSAAVTKPENFQGLTDPRQFGMDKISHAVFFADGTTFIYGTKSSQGNTKKVCSIIGKNNSKNYPLTPFLQTRSASIIEVHTAQTFVERVDRAKLDGAESDAVFGSQVSFTEDFPPMAQMTYVLSATPSPVKVRPQEIMIHQLGVPIIYTDSKTGKQKVVTGIGLDLLGAKQGLRLKGITKTNKSLSGAQYEKSEKSYDDQTDSFSHGMHEVFEKAQKGKGKDTQKESPNNGDALKDIFRNLDGN